MQAIPLCPITGLPAERRIQSISARLIRGLWRGAFGVSTDRPLAGINHFGLWESPCGLAFFDPMLPGDEALAPHLPHAAHVGLDPHCYANAAELDVRVADPLDFSRDLVKCVRPGGRLCIVVPSLTSPLTEIPNFVLNAPPNHLSW